MITLKNISLSFGNRAIFDELTATIKENDRIGLVGRNGYGKSTLLKVIVGQQEIDGGTVSLLGGKRIAYLNQEIFLDSEKSVLDHIVDSSQEIANTVYHGTAQVRAQADKILRGLGFSTDRLQMRVNALSGGWKMRVLLAQLLVQKADFYLFDEPTNHLDIVAKEWFLQFLKQAQFGFLLVCHEKYFLNMLCTSIFALDTPQGVWYDGNYDSYIVRYHEQNEARQAAYIQQQKMIRQKKETIARFGASASRASQAQSMKKELEKMVRIEPQAQKTVLNVPLPPIKQSAKTVLSVHNLSTGYADVPLFSGLNFTVTRNEKIAVIAANGVGKTTLLHALASKIPLLAGTASFGDQVTSALFHQEQSLILKPEHTVWDEVMHDLQTTYTDAQIRSLLGCFLFSHDDIYKKIAVLSGGEKSRVGMIKVLLKQANLLLLDEPTNHLDIPSKDVLLKALQEYSGSILFVSHDQDFVNQLATAVIELTATSAICYPGNYHAYLQQKEYLSSATNQPATYQDHHNSLKQPRKANTPAVAPPENLTKKIQKIEREIDKITKQRATLTVELGQLVYGTATFTQTYTLLEKLERQEQELHNEWEHYYQSFL